MIPLVTEISAVNIEQVCENCLKTNVIAIVGLIAGVSGDKNIITLPACSCGSIECLNRTFTNMGSHAALVNGIHEHLIKKDKIHDKWRNELKNETIKPQRKLEIKE